MEWGHGGDLYTARENGLQEVLDFSANLNPLGLPKGVRALLQELPQDCYTCYPDPFCRVLTAELAAFHQLPQQWLLCGNGAAELIYRLAWALRPKRALVLAPCFSEYRQALAGAGCLVQDFALREQEDFCVTPRLLNELSYPLDILFLCSPNNPTGQLIDFELLELVAGVCAKNGIVLALDECFLGFADDSKRNTLLARLGDFPTTIVLRAFTKFFAMAGLRLGYCASSDLRLLEKMRCSGPPWSVSGPAQQAGVQALREREYQARTRALICFERAFLQEGLRKLGCKVYESQANFVLFWASDPALCQKLKPYGILIRSCANFTGLNHCFYRIAVRTRPQNERLLCALKELLCR